MCFSHAAALGALSTRLNKSTVAVKGLITDYNALKNYSRSFQGEATPCQVALILDNSWTSGALF
jgi:hypothetical protein